MTRKLHPATKPQRAIDPGVEPRAKRRRGYEDRDAPAGKVALGVAGFLGLLAAGVALPALAIPALDRALPLRAARTDRPVFPHASLPPLLADPVAHRRKLEAETEARLGAARIRRAAARVERKGLEP
ncbi:MAG: hypothetical protein J7496_09670 [Novosphingobium sp.]|nr:hypothetical protein [Novosphingobium sp.]